MSTRKPITLALCAAVTFAPIAPAIAGVGQVQGIIAQDFGAPVQVDGVPTDGQILTYQASTGKWRAAAAAAGPTTSPLSVVLANGNASGANNIVMGSAQAITWTDAGVSRSNTASLAIGNGSSGDTSGTIVLSGVTLGNIKITSPTNTLVFGSSGGGALTCSNVYFGGGNTASGPAPSYTLFGTPAFGTDTNGGNITLSSGLSTGLGNSSLNFAVSLSGFTSSSLTNTAPVVASIAGVQRLLSGTNNLWTVNPVFADSGNTSSGVMRTLYLNPTINNTAASKTGAYEALVVNAVETSLPTGTNYLMRLQAGAAGGTDMFTVTNTGTVTTTNHLLAPNGSVAAPSYSFSAEAGLGVYRRAAATLSFAAGGIERVNFNSSGLYVFGGVGISGGSVDSVAPDLFLNRGGVGIATFTDGAGSFARIQLGGATNLFPAIKRSGAALHVRLADDSGWAGMTADSMNCITQMDIGAFGDCLMSRSSANSVNYSFKLSKYNNVATAGWGVPAIYASGRATAQTAANASVATYTVGAADGSFEVSVNVLITTLGSGSFNAQVTYTDESNAARTMALPVLSPGSAVTTSISSAGPSQGIPIRIRCKASTVVTILTAGTFTGCTYNVEADIKQVS